jgi:hypothetical protein
MKVVFKMKKNNNLTIEHISIESLINLLNILISEVNSKMYDFEPLTIVFILFGVV